MPRPVVPAAPSTNTEGFVAAVKAAHRHFGRLDVVVTNAAYGQYGMVEELSEKEARSQMDANFFGPLWIAQAALPILRGQRGGHIIAVSSDTTRVVFGDEDGFVYIYQVELEPLE